MYWSLGFRSNWMLHLYNLCYPLKWSHATNYGNNNFFFRFFFLLSSAWISRMHTLGTTTHISRDQRLTRLPVSIRYLHGIKMTTTTKKQPNESVRIFAARPMAYRPQKSSRCERNACQRIDGAQINPVNCFFNHISIRAIEKNMCSAFEIVLGPANGEKENTRRARPSTWRTVANQWIRIAAANVCGEWAPIEAHRMKLVKNKWLNTILFISIENKKKKRKKEAEQQTQWY